MFICHRKDNAPVAFHYLKGLFQARKRNIERMGEAIAGTTDYEATQHFISESPWDHRIVMDRVAREADGVLGGTADTALVIDESGFTKKGTRSVGVSRQWNGRLGKVDNCQVGVFGALCAGRRGVLVDARLFLPEKWVSDPERCKIAGVPESEIQSRSKIDLALEIIKNQRDIGTRFSYVLADSLYGNSGIFTRSLDDDGVLFLVHIHPNHKVFLDDPSLEKTEVFERGKKTKKLKIAVNSVQVDQIAGELRAEDWTRAIARDSTAGPLRRLAWDCEVWIRDGREGSARKWRLIVVKEIGGNIKYCLSNADSSYSLQRLVEMEANRHGIESVFQEAKSTIGMAEYQVRGWRGWHHHIALSMLALLFIMKQKVIYGEEYPLLSANDIRYLLAALLPRGDLRLRKVVNQMRRRHQQRKSASESKKRRNELK